ncbi:MAG TPA: histidine phosphatase family protein [Myxococcota bacterium]
MSGPGLQPAPDGAAAREARERAEPHARIVLLRHAEPDWAPGGGASVPDPGLTAFGRAQARAAAEHLAGHAFDAIYVSPCRRAQETAAPLAEARGLVPVTVEGLAEIGVAVEGLSQDEVDRYFVEGSLRPLNEHWNGWPGAEAFRAFHARVTAALEAVLGEHAVTSTREHDFDIWHFEAARPSLALVAHAGTNAVALAHLLGVRPVPWEWLRFESELAAYSVLQARPIGPSGHAWSLQNFNEVDHLKAAGLREEMRP